MPAQARKALPHVSTTGPAIEIKKRAVMTGAGGCRPGDVVLTSLVPGDSEAMFRWINDRANVLLSAPYRPVSRAEHDAWFESIQRRKDVVICAIRLAESGQLIGSCQLLDIHPVIRSAELRIRIGEPSQRGRGLGTQAVEALLSLGFRDLNLNRVFLTVFEDNEPAHRLYLKTGFVEEGLLRQAAYIDGRSKSLRMMSILREDYDRRHPPA
jgi:RimJ/RimL family protein N-acetyltransferase